MIRAKVRVWVFNTRVGDMFARMECEALHYRAESLSNTVQRLQKFDRSFGGFNLESDR